MKRTMIAICCAAMAAVAFALNAGKSGCGPLELGGDIMIHGKAVTIGCVPVGDDAIEDIFYLAYAVGIKNVSVVIAPYDMRSGRKLELEKSSIAWYPDLCREIAAALSDGKRASTAAVVQPSAAK